MLTKSIVVKAILAGAAIVVATLLGLSCCLRPPSDSQLIKELFEPEFPGYSAIKVLGRSGEGTIDNPRVLVIEVVMESYEGPVTCQGEIGYFCGDPSSHWLRWYDWGCISHWMLIQDARMALFWDQDKGGPPLCDTRIEDMALVLRGWVEKGWVDVKQIRHPDVQARVAYLIENNISSTGRPATLFDVYEARVYDLVPELPAEEKVPTYVLRCDGALDLILRGGPRWWEQPLDLQAGDRILPLPAEKSTTRP